MNLAIYTDVHVLMDACSASQVVLFSYHARFAYVM
jgi:hypothetical protein